MSDPVILVIEDDPAVRRGIVDVLEYAGYQTLEAADGYSGMELALKATYRLLLLDLVMPGPSGFEILEALKRQRPGQAVIILSARGEENDRVHGLVHGADDYVVKPFGMKELLARVDAVLRRSCERAAPADQRRIPGATVDFRGQLITFDDGRSEALSDREACLLRYLIDSAGRLVTRDEILRHLWGLNPDRTATRTIDMLPEERTPDENPHHLVHAAAGRVTGRSPSPDRLWKKRREDRPDLERFRTDPGMPLPGYDHQRSDPKGRRDRLGSLRVQPLRDLVRCGYRAVLAGSAERLLDPQQRWGYLL